MRSVDAFTITCWTKQTLSITCWTKQTLTITCWTKQTLTTSYIHFPLKTHVLARKLLKLPKLSRVKPVSSCRQGKEKLAAVSKVRFCFA